MSFHYAQDSLQAAGVLARSGQKLAQSLASLWLEATEWAWRQANTSTLKRTLCQSLTVAVTLSCRAHSVAL